MIEAYLAKYPQGQSANSPTSCWLIMARNRPKGRTGDHLKGGFRIGLYQNTIARPRKQGSFRRNEPNTVLDVELGRSAIASNASSNKRDGDGRVLPRRRT